jgi:hypothetical protein
VPAPDYVEPLVGWRCWAAAWVEGELRLCSPIYALLWPFRDPVQAECQAGHKSLLSRRRPPEHSAPHEGCGCGIYAADSPRRAVSFLPRASSDVVPGEIVEPVLGRVSVWGRVLECEHGWRAEYAYPLELYLAVQDSRPAARFWQRAVEDRRRALEEVTRLLGGYGVPVETLAADSLGDIASVLEG